MSHIKEEWKPVVGFEGVYEVSDSGHVRRIGKSNGVTHGRLMKPQAVRAGYQAVVLRTPGNRHAKYIHRLVAEAFIGPIALGMHVNHLDGNPKNNTISNLEIATPSENILHAIHVLWPERDYHAKRLNRDAVREIRAMARAYTYPAIAGIFNISEKTVYNVVSRQTWKHVD